MRLNTPSAGSCTLVTPTPLSAAGVGRGAGSRAEEKALGVVGNSCWM